MPAAVCWAAEGKKESVALNTETVTAPTTAALAPAITTVAARERSVQATDCPPNEPRDRERQEDEKQQPLRVIDSGHLGAVDPPNQVIE